MVKSYLSSGCVYFFSADPVQYFPYSVDVGVAVLTHGFQSCAGLLPFVVLMGHDDPLWLHIVPEERFDYVGYFCGGSFALEHVCCVECSDGGDVVCFPVGECDLLLSVSDVYVAASVVAEILLPRPWQVGRFELFGDFGEFF